MRPIPPQAIDLIKRFEGCRLTAYRDIAGFWTLGVGHLVTRDKIAPMPPAITQEQADALLLVDLARTAKSVLGLIKRPSLTDNQYSALLSFTFNLGGGALQRSTLRQKCNRGDDAGAPAEFMKWVRAGGKISRGLVRRRAAEAALYAMPDAKPDHIADAGNMVRW